MLSVFVLDGARSVAFFLHHALGRLAVVLLLGFRRSKWGTTKMPPVWDVEEAVQLGKENQTCPYYNARDSLTTADLVLW